MARKTKRTSYIKNHGALLLGLLNSKPEYRKHMIQRAPPELIHCFAECCQNVLKGHVPLTPRQKQQLSGKRHQLRQLADPKVTVVKKKKVLNQKGGFLPLAAKLLLPVLAPVVGKALKDVIR